MPKPTIRKDLVTTKSVSLPISVLEAILDEADIMHETFSGALTKLVKLGISVRRSERERDSRLQKEQEEKDLERVLGRA